MGSTACTERQCLYKGALYLFLPFPKMLQNIFSGVGRPTGSGKSNAVHFTVRSPETCPADVECILSVIVLWNY